MNNIISKFREVFFSVLPITLIVVFLHFTLTPMELPVLLRFIIGSVFVVIGLTLFLLGVDLGIVPLGSYTGESLSKTNKLWIVLGAGAILGFFISIAEPGLQVLANQVGFVTSGQISGVSILIFVSLGLAVMIAVGFLRIFYNIPIFKLLIAFYALIFILSLFTSREFLAIAFDASGATTGILAVPFILSLSVGISKRKKDSKASEKDSFGLVAIASIGAIIAVMIIGIFSNTQSFNAQLEVSLNESSSLIQPYLDVLGLNIRDSFMAIMPLLVILLFLQRFVFKLRKKEMRKLITGFIFAFAGLLLFFIGVNTGFMDVGTFVGSTLITHSNRIYVILFGFILGVVTILAEPAVYVLTHQIEDVTAGYVKRKAVLIPLAIGVGLAVALSVLRVLVPAIQLWHYLLPGYIISMVLMFFTPKLFIAIAFDAGGVATGPVTATFILAFIQGAAHAFEGADLLVDGFGMIAMVAMMPIITLEILGYFYGLSTRKKGVKQHG